MILLIDLRCLKSILDCYGSQFCPLSVFVYVMRFRGEEICLRYAGNISEIRFSYLVLIT